MKNTNKKSLIKSLLLFLFLFALIYSGNKKDLQNNNIAIIEEIFDNILLTLPENIKMDIDSVSANNSNITNKDYQSNGNATVGKKINNDKRFQKLPVNIQNQVEKTILEIDKSRENRKLQFKEKKKKN